MKNVLRLLSVLGLLLPAASAVAGGMSGGGATCTQSSRFSWMITTSSSPWAHCKYVASKSSEDQIREFVAVNQTQLMEDMSQGRGQALADYATILGCSADAVPAFGKAAQENFDKIFARPQNAEQILKSTRENILNARELRHRCETHLS